MTITRTAYKKWTKITLICGAHSFVWGALTKSSVLAMVLGLLTLISLFAFIESHPLYQSRRTAAPRLARALDGGVRFRMWFAGYVLLSYLFMFAMNHASPLKSVGLLAFSGYAAELFIGMGATAATNFITGIDPAGIVRSAAAQTYNWPEIFLSTYLTTIITGLIHTVILAVICLLAYGVVRLRDARKAKRPDSAVGE